jgi:hypothetical protein
MSALIRAKSGPGWAAIIAVLLASRLAGCGGGQDAADGDQVTQIVDLGRSGFRVALIVDRSPRLIDTSTAQPCRALTVVVIADAAANARPLDAKVNSATGLGTAVSFEAIQPYRQGSEQAWAKPTCDYRSLNAGDRADVEFTARRDGVMWLVIGTGLIVSSTE